MRTEHSQVWGHCQKLTVCVTHMCWTRSCLETCIPRKASGMISYRRSSLWNPSLSSPIRSLFSASTALVLQEAERGQHT